MVKPARRALLALACAWAGNAVAEPPPKPPEVEPILWIAPAYADRPACAQDFVPFATGASAPFLTDGLVVLKDGKRLVEFYDGTFDRTKPHPLWSASKTVTATLLGAAIQAGMTDAEGSRLSLDTPLETALDTARDPAVAARDRARFAEITLAHLVEMTAGFAWEESYEGAVEDSSVLRMLYRDGHADMARFALNQPVVFPPGERWIYSGGNVNLIMAVLRHFAGEDYPLLPWTLLFDPLGLGRDGGAPVVVERDRSGTFVGSSYVYMAPRDMARLGQLYLDDGVADGRRVLPEVWVRDARQLVPALRRVDLGPDYVDYVNREGLYSRRGFWLNVEVPGLAVQFPASPRDMFFAAGHYGQLIVLLPGERIVIARTGHDVEYWSKIDAFVSKAVACFAQ